MGRNIRGNKKINKDIRNHGIVMGAIKKMK